MSPRVKIQSEPRKELSCPAGAVLGESLLNIGVPLNLYCGGRGVCGKCFIEVVEGNIPEAENQERRLREISNLPEGFRLSCRLQINGDISINIPPASLLPQMPVLVSGKSRPVSLEPILKKIVLDVPAGSPGPQAKAVLSVLDSVWPGLERGLSSDIDGLPVRGSPPSGPSAFTAVVYDERELLAVEPGDTSDRSFGLAVDLGTTTLAVELLDLADGRTIGTAAGLNGQASFGADVVSRISAAFGNPSRLEELRAAVVRSLNDLIGGLLGRTKTSPAAVYEAVLAGNTAMNHLFLGSSVDGLAVSPFEGNFRARPPLPAGGTGLVMNPRGRTYLVPNIGGFVGGDITAGLVASGLDELSGVFLYIDLGTNGEIALKKGEVFAAASTAAGPAFEGMSLSCGMLALPGAIGKASYRDGRFAVETIGALPPKGVCGTGLIDLVAASLEAGLVTPGGKIVDPARRLPVIGTISLTQQDVRELQLAAAAVKTGIRMLLESEGLSVADLDGIFVAGAFGASLDAEKAMKIGLLPRSNPEKLTVVGNASLAGARAFLLSRSERRRGERLARRVRHVALAKGGDFQSQFIDALEFKEWT